MPVDSVNSTYREHVDDWQMARDAVSGQRAIHRQGEKYLPRLGQGQDDKEYLEWRDRATFLGAAGRTVDGLQGLVFRKSPQVEAPESMAAWQENVTGEGHSLVCVATWIIAEQLTTGRGGLLVDMPNVNLEGMSRAQVETMNLTPFIRTYAAENITNWHLGKLPDGTFGPVMVVLKETYELENESDEFEKTTEVQYRVLDLPDGQYRMRLFQTIGRTSKPAVGSTTGGWAVVEEVFPMMNGAPMNFIPFRFFGADSNTYEVSKSPLIDLVNLNVQHYKVSADYYGALHKVGQPTVVISGLDGEGSEVPVAIGADAMWVFSDPNTKASFLQVNAKDFAVLSDEMKALEGRMASMGARILTEDKKAAESGAALSIRSRGEQSVLAMVSTHTSMVLTWAMGVVARWLGTQDTANIWIELNKDFMTEPMSGQDLTALMGAWQAGAISKRTLFEALKRGEVIAEDRTYEDEEEEIMDGAAGLEELMGGLDGSGSGQQGGGRDSLSADDVEDAQGES